MITLLCAPQIKHNYCATESLACESAVTIANCALSIVEEIDINKDIISLVMKL